MLKSLKLNCVYIIVQLRSVIEAFRLCVGCPNYGVWFIKYEVERMEVDEMTGPLRDNFQNELDMSNNLFFFSRSTFERSVRDQN